MSRKQRAPEGVSKLLADLSFRFHYALLRSGNQAWAGCSSEDSPDPEQQLSAYVAEPGIAARSSRELRAAVLVLVNEEHGEDVYLVADLIQRRVARMKGEVWTKLKVALQFILDRRFHPDQPVKDAVNGLLNYHPRSYTGNDLNTGVDVLRRTWVRVRALQLSKQRRSGVPKRPKERAEPTHDWLPGWQSQYQPDVLDHQEPEIPIEELLSPAEVAFHFSRA